MKQFVIQGVTYDYPENGTEPSWGEEATTWAEAITTTVSGLSSDGDILTRDGSLSDNKTSVENVIGMSFDSSQFQGFITEVSVFRTCLTKNAAETISLYGSYNPTLGQWEMSQTGVGKDSEITFSITVLGQIQYTSTLWGTGHSCRIVFRARAFTS